MKTISHPTDPTARLIRRMLQNHRLDKIEMTVTLQLNVARAIPASYHPVVAKRRDEAYAMRSGSISLDEATAINEAARDGSVAIATGKTMLMALTNLEAQLVAFEAEWKA